MMAPRSPLYSPPAPELLALWRRSAASTVVPEIRCDGCGYGAVVAASSRALPDGREHQLAGAVRGSRVGGAAVTHYLINGLHSGYIGFERLIACAPCAMFVARWQRNGRRWGHGPIGVGFGPRHSR